MAIFDYKTGDFLRSWPFSCPPIEVAAIYIYIYRSYLCDSLTQAHFRDAHLRIALWSPASIWESFADVVVENRQSITLVWWQAYGAPSQKTDYVRKAFWSNYSSRQARDDSFSLSPKAGHPKAGRSDFRNQRFKPDTGKMRKMRTSLPPQENKGLRRLRRTKTRKTRKMRTRKRGKCGKCGKCG